MCQVAIARTIDKDLRFKGLQTVFILNDYRTDSLALHLATNHCRVGVNIHARLQNHSLATEFVEFYVEVDVCFRPLDKGAAHRFESLDKLPRNTADYQLVFQCKYTDRGNVAYGSHSAEESVSLNDCGFCALACCGYCCDESRWAATCYYNIISAGQWCKFANLATFGV